MLNAALVIWLVDAAHGFPHAAIGESKQTPEQRGEGRF